MRRDDARRGTRARGASPLLESLEGRQLLSAVNGGAWTQPQRITYSFVPDGTDTGGIPSALFSTLNAVASTSTWQDQFRKAAASWEQVANINLVQVSDNGEPLSATGDQQGDPNIGDIRIAAAPLGAGILAEAFLPPPINGGTLSGDIEFNSQMAWGISKNFDIETVAIHEIGHALGMDHSAFTTADMYAYYNNQKQSLTSDDITGIQGVYGARPNDRFDAISSNQTTATATDITPFISGSQISLSGLDIQSLNDYDFYKVTVPSTTTGTMTITMQSTALSSLSPRLQVLNASNQTLGTASVVGAFGATVTVSIGGVSAGQVYTIKATAAGGGPTSAGAYGLLLNFGSGSQSPIAPPNTTVASQADSGGGSSNDQIPGLPGPGTDTDGQDGKSKDDKSKGGKTIQIGTLVGIGDAMTILPRLRSRAGGNGSKHRVATVAAHGHFDAAIEAMHGRSHRATPQRVHARG